MTLNAHLAASYGCYLFKWKDLYLHFARLGHATILGKDVESSDEDVFNPNIVNDLFCVYKT